LKRLLTLLALGTALSVNLSAQQESDPHWKIHALEEAKALPGTATVTIDGTLIHQFQPPANHALTNAKLINVSGQPFSKAFHIEILQPTHPAYLVQLISPTTCAPIQKGDNLLLVYYVRCTESKRRDQGHFAAYLQLSHEPWSGFGGFSGSPGRQWQKYYQYFLADENRPPGEMEIAFHLGQESQTLEFGGLELFNLGPNVEPSQLPHNIITYAGQEPDATWRKAAQERIERLRKGDLEIRVTTANGAPVPGAAVHVRMLRHAYQFGTFLEGATLWDNSDGATYRNTTKKLFNRVTVPLYWADWGWDNPEIRQQYWKLARWAHEQGFHIRGHNLVWPSWHNTPSWLRQFEKDPRRLQNIIHASVAERVALFRQFEFDDYDVVNELRENHEIYDILGFSEVVEWFRLTHLLDPRPKAGINEYDIIAGGGYTETEQATYEKHIRALLDQGAPLGVIGMQCHMGESLTPPEQVLAILDRFAKFGLPLQATEFDIDIADEKTQGDYMRDFLTAFFSHPATEAITQWGFWQSQHWKPRAALFRKDWRVKPNGQAYLDLVLKEWWTDVSGQTGPDGIYRVRGFCGDYAIDVSANGTSHTYPAKIGHESTTLKAAF